MNDFISALHGLIKPSDMEALFRIEAVFSNKGYIDHHLAVVNAFSGKEQQNEDVAVNIINVYWQHVEQGLRDMGITLVDQDEGALTLPMLSQLLTGIVSLDGYDNVDIIDSVFQQQDMSNEYLIADILSEVTELDKMDILTLIDDVSDATIMQLQKKLVDPDVEQTLQDFTKSLVKEFKAFLVTTGEIPELMEIVRQSESLPIIWGSKVERFGDALAKENHPSSYLANALYGFTILAGIPAGERKDKALELRMTLFADAFSPIDPFIDKLVGVTNAQT
jgi:hypothetical protein